MNELALAIFAVVLALAVTCWASKRTHTATEFWAARPLARPPLPRGTDHPRSLRGVSAGD